jgi:hypothetical protein
MDFRSRLTPLAVLLSATFLAWGTGSALAGPIYEFAINDTSSLAGTTGSLEFQFTQDPLNPSPATATVANVGGGTPFGPSPTLIFSGTPTGTLIPPGVLGLPNVDMNGQSADVFQDYTFGDTLFFYVSFDGPGTFYLSVWNQQAADVGTTASQEFSSGDPSGAALVVSVDSNGYATVIAAGPGVQQIPEPSSLALVTLGGIAVAAWRWRRRRAA